jgi:hypothetical protein
MVLRMMKLTDKAPDQRVVIDPEAGSDGTTTLDLRLLGIQGIVGDSEDGHAPPCDDFLAGRIEQFIVDKGYFDDLGP